MNFSRWPLRISTILTFVLAAFSSHAAEPAPEESFVSLFDGKSLTGWIGALDAYGAEDGKLVCLEGAAGNLLTEREYRDFEFRFEFRLAAGANNGLGVRCPPVAKGNLHLEGVELQILDDSAEKYQTLQPYQYHGSVYGIQPARRGHLKPVGEWNAQEVTVHGRRIKVVLNGETIVDVNLDEATKNGTLDGQPHPGLTRETGRLGFLGHGDRVEFRNLRIREIETPIRGIDGVRPPNTETTTESNR